MVSKVLVYVENYYLTSYTTPNQILNPYFRNETMKLAQKTEVIKASPAIQIQSKITHLQRRAWNVLLANAYDELPTHEKHSVEVVELAESLEFDSGNRDYLKEALIALQGCQVTWDLLHKDGKKEWGVASLLSQAVIKGGICTYAYAPDLRTKLHNPRIYAKINLRLQNKFKSKYALILWEVCFDYFDESRNEGETPFIPLDTFRELMGIDSKEYQEFKRLNRYVIKAPIKEINEEAVGFLIEVEYKRGYRRKVVSVKFRILKLKQISKPETKQGTLFPDIDDLPLVAVELIQAGVSRQEALKISNQEWGYVAPNARPENPTDFSQFIQEKIHLAKNTRGVENVGGFLIAAIHENYPNLEFQKELEERREKELKRKIAELEKKKSNKQNALIQEIIANDITIIEKAAEKITFSYTKERIDIYGSATEAYVQAPIVKSEINRIIREVMYTDRFKPIEEEYEK